MTSFLSPALCFPDGLRVGIYFGLLGWSWGTLKLKFESSDKQAWQKFVPKGPTVDPEGFAGFIDCTHALLREVLTLYGKIDLLWYDTITSCDGSAVTSPNCTGYPQGSR